MCTQPEGCAAKTSVPPLKVGHQVLQVDDTSLHGLRHKETVMAIKSAFEGPMNKTITFVVLDSKEVGMGSCNGVHTTARSGEWCVYFLC